jgi:hypothetical protein
MWIHRSSEHSSKKLKNGKRSIRSFGNKHFFNLIWFELSCVRSDATSHCRKTMDSNTEWRNEKTKSRKITQNLQYFTLCPQRYFRFNFNFNLIIFKKTVIELLWFQNQIENWICSTYKQTICSQIRKE